nr:sensor domain-containing diguanylate cyclase [uncultured Desulfobulbus sp.]
MDSNTTPTPHQLLAVIRMQTKIAKMGLDLAGVMSLVTEQTLTVIGALGAVVELAEGDDMVYRAVAGAAHNLLGVRLPRSHSLSGLCMTANMAVLSEDCEVDDRVNRDVCRRIGVRSLVTAPLIHQDIPVGALKVYANVPYAFSDADVTLLSLMAETIAAAMYRSAKFGEDALFRQATLDALTGLANRALFFDRFYYSISRARRERSGFGVLILDMDGLKPINDQFGHRAGDAALKEIGRRLSLELRQSDTVARLGGDEFGLILSPMDRREDLILVVRRIVERCNQYFSFEGRILPLRVSIGEALYPDDGEEIEPLLEVAEHKMHLLKRQYHSFH